MSDYLLTNHTIEWLIDWLFSEDFLSSSTQNAFFNYSVDYSVWNIIQLKCNSEVVNGGLDEKENSIGL